MQLKLLGHRTERARVAVTSPDLHWEGRTEALLGFLSPPLQLPSYNLQTGYSHVSYFTLYPVLVYTGVTTLSQLRRLCGVGVHCGNSLCYGIQQGIAPSRHAQTHLKFYTLWYSICQVTILCTISAKCHKTGSEMHTEFSQPSRGPSFVS
jgi:bacterioferritin-associated ferredoxin